MAQTRRDSLIETCTNTFVGMAGSFAITLTTINLVKDPLIASTITVFLCTVWSLVRGYVIRRRFNRTIS